MRGSLLKNFKSWGYDAKIETFEVLVPFPKIRKLEMVAPKKMSFQLKEPALKEDATPSITKDLLQVTMRFQQMAM
ncbi:MAG: hypothetical protein Ct9H300mP18_05060 [Candidatus Neomarinimicrobiota bacterium]|nr:MAG: hypothetical protein Ct9H300mP18_05060 [Candidatus Neomarinimicrobiota bacterium]